MFFLNATAVGVAFSTSPIADRQSRRDERQRSEGGQNLKSERQAKMVVERTSLHYPNLQSCGVILSGTPSATGGGGSGSGSDGSSSSSGPVSMPREALDALVPLPPPYSFEVGT